MVDPQNEQPLEQQREKRLIWDSVWPELMFINKKWNEVKPRNEQINLFLLGTMGHLNGFCPGREKPASKLKLKLSIRVSRESIIV